MVDFNPTPEPGHGYSECPVCAVTAKKLREMKDRVVDAISEDDENINAPQATACLAHVLGYVIRESMTETPTNVMTIHLLKELSANACKVSFDYGHQSQENSDSENHPGT